MEMGKEIILGLEKCHNKGAVPDEGEANAGSWGVGRKGTFQSTQTGNEWTRGMISLFQWI